MVTGASERSGFLEQWQHWHDAREEELRTPHGWLSLTALHWLGRSPERFDGLPGRWWHDDEGIWFEPGGAQVLLDGVAIGERRLVGDAAGASVGVLTTGERRLELIGRGAGNRGVRVRDPHAATRTSFAGVPTFAVDPGWRIVARYAPLAAAEKVAVGSASERVQHERTLIGHATFTYEGAEHTLAVSGGHAVSIAFRDATSGRESFGLLRQLPVEPSADGTVVLDFNRAANPPCSFTDYGTCPLPPPGNVLPFAVTAGEKAPERLA